MRTDIFKEMMRMQEEMDRLFESAFMEPRRDQNLLATKSRSIAPFRSPVAHIQETESSVLAAVELPGIDKQDITLTVSEDALEVKAEKKHQQEEKRDGFYSYSQGMTQFYKKMYLPSHVDASSAKAEYKDGMLRIEIPKLAGSGNKRIAIS